MTQQKKEMTDFDEHLAEKLKNPEFKKWYDYYGKQLELSYSILQMRKKQKMTQAELAKKLQTKQSNVARMESGQQNFTLSMLHKIAVVFGHDLTVKFVK